LALQLYAGPFGFVKMMLYFIDRSLTLIPNSYLQLIFRGTYWARFWSQLSKEKARKCMKNNYKRLEGPVMELFTRSALQETIYSMTKFNEIFMMFLEIVTDLQLWVQSAKYRDSLSISS
jgi:hypothetical protein